MPCMTLWTYKVCCLSFGRWPGTPGIDNTLVYHPLLPALRRALGTGQSHGDHQQGQVVEHPGLTCRQTDALQQRGNQMLYTMKTTLSLDS